MFEKFKKLIPLNKKIKDIIFRVEIIAGHSGVSVISVLEKYAQEIGKDNKKVSKVLLKLSRQLKANKKRWVVYEPYLDKDILDFLIIADKKNIPASTIFEEYAPLKELAEKYISSIRRGLISPVAVFFLLVLGLGSIISKFSSFKEQGIIKFSDFANFCIENFYIVNFSFLVLLVVLFIFIPNKLPILKTVFKQLDSMLALSTVQTMFSLGYAAGDIVSPLIKQFNLKAKRPKQNIDGLVKLLKEVGFINTYESANIKISIAHGDTNKLIQPILKNRKEEITKLNDVVKNIIKNISLLLLALPIMMTVIVFMNLLSSMSNLTN